MLREQRQRNQTPSFNQTRKCPETAHSGQLEVSRDSCSCFKSETSDPKTESKRGRQEERATVTVDEA
eukprot:418278-Rhodomonas_salina.1